MLVDESGFSAESLQQLTHTLCHTYPACNRWGVRGKGKRAGGPRVGWGTMGWAHPAPWAIDRLHTCCASQGLGASRGSVAAENDSRESAEMSPIGTVNAFAQ